MLLLFIRRCILNENIINSDASKTVYEGTFSIVKSLWNSQFVNQGDRHEV